MSTLVITPIQSEFHYLRQSCAKQGVKAIETKIGRLSVLYFPELTMYVALGGLGKTQFAVQTQYLIDHCAGLEAVICAGAAGALTPELQIGDVVVATETVEHDIRNHFGKPLLPRFLSDPATLYEFQQLPQNGSFTCYFGPIASGDEDVVDLERGRAIQQQTGAFAVAWEGAGGARACQFSHVPFVEMRGITDNADHSAAADFTKNLELAQHNVATVITQWAVARQGG